MPERRNITPEVVRARGRLGGLIARRAPAEEIERARAELRNANARLAVRELLVLPADERAELAVLLLSGSGDAAA